jgi:hypothetical protein
MRAERPRCPHADDQPPPQIACPAASAEPDLGRVAQVERPPGADNRQHQQHLEDAVVDARELEREAEATEPNRDPWAGYRGDGEQQQDKPEKSEGAHREAV